MKAVAATILVLAVLVGACGGTDGGDGGKLESSKAALAATQNVTNNLVDVGGVLSFLDEATVFDKSLDLFSSQTCIEMQFPEDGSEPVEVEVPCPDDEGGEIGIAQDTKDMAEDFAKWLGDYVFADAQFESGEGDTFIYLAKAEVFCKSFEDTVEPGESTPAKPAMPERTGEAVPVVPEGDGAALPPDAENPEASTSEDCAEMLSKIPMRLKLESSSEGNYDLWMLFGEDRVAPVHMQVYKDMLAVDFDLALTKDVVQMFIDAYAEEGDEQPLPDVFEGNVRVELKKVADGKFKLTWSVVETVTVGMVSGDDQYLVTVAPGSLSAEASKVAKTLAWNVAFGSVSVALPYQTWVNMAWSPAEPEAPVPAEPAEPPAVPPVPADDITNPEAEPPTVTGDLSIYVAGINGNMVFDGKSDTATFSNVGLGTETSFVKLDDATLIAVDLNPDNGRGLAASVAPDGDNVIVSVDPLLDFAIAWGLEAILGEFPDLPDWMLQEVFTVALDSATPPKVRFLKDEVGGEGTGSLLEILAGKLVMASTGAPADTVTVSEGLCLNQKEEAPEERPVAEPPPEDEETSEAHGLLGNLVGGECK